MTKGAAKAKGNAGGAATAKPVSGYMKAATAGVGLVGATALGRSVYNQYQDRRYYAPRAVDARAKRFVIDTGRARVAAEHDQRIAEARAREEAARVRAEEAARRSEAADAAAARLFARARGLDAIAQAGAHARRAHQVASPQGGVFNLRRQHSPRSVAAMIDQRLAEL